MKKLCIGLMVFISIRLNAQDSLSVVKNDSATVISSAITTTDDNNTKKYYSGSSPYTTSFKKDGPITLGLIGLNVLGLQLIQNKKGLTPAELATKTRDKVPSFDRGNVGYYDESIDEASYPVMYSAYALPVAVALLNGKERNRFGQVLVLYTETMAVTGALFSITAGSINRSRPLVYSAEAPMSTRLSNNSQRSFFAGHTASVASSTFFMAKVFSDFNPDSKLKPVVWAVAAAVPSYIGYSRYKSGHHFLSDNIIGYTVGAAAGILIPHWHKTSKMKNVSIVPNVGSNYTGMALTYKF